MLTCFQSQASSASPFGNRSTLLESRVISLRSFAPPTIIFLREDSIAKAMSTSTLALTQAGNHPEREFCTAQFTLSRRDIPSFRAGRTSTLDAINHVKLSNPGVFFRHSIGLVGTIP
jgi:hypothetical protein